MNIQSKTGMIRKQIKVKTIVKLSRECESEICGVEKCRQRSQMQISGVQLNKNKVRKMKNVEKLKLKYF